MQCPSPIDNPNLTGFEVIFTTGETKGAYGSWVRARLVRHSDPSLPQKAFLIWEEWQGDRDSKLGFWEFKPGTSGVDCTSLVVDLMWENNRLARALSRSQKQLGEFTHE